MRDILEHVRMAICWEVEYKRNLIDLSLQRHETLFLQQIVPLQPISAPLRLLIVRRPSAGEFPSRGLQVLSAIFIWIDVEINNKWFVYYLWLIFIIEITIRI